MKTEYHFICTDCTFSKRVLVLYNHEDPLQRDITLHQWAVRYKQFEATALSHDTRVCAQQLCSNMAVLSGFSSKQRVNNLLELIEELFEDARKGNFEIVSKLEAVKPDEFLAVTNTRNNQGHTLLQVAITNKHRNIASKLLEMIRKPDKIQSCSSSKCGLEQLKKLKSAAEVYISFSELYLPILRIVALSIGLDRNPCPWYSLKQGSYYLGNAYSLVKTYKECMPGVIGDKNIQVIDATLVALEFDPEHITSGYTDEAYGGKVSCFVSRGQGTVYYKWLHSKLKEDIGSFVEMVERDIDAPAKRFLESIKQKLICFF